MQCKSKDKAITPQELVDVIASPKNHYCSTVETKKRVMYMLSHIYIANFVGGS